MKAAVILALVLAFSIPVLSLAQDKPKPLTLAEMEKNLIILTQRMTILQFRYKETSGNRDRMVKAIEQAKAKLANKKTDSSGDKKNNE